MSSRFEERLRTGPPIVADGGMGDAALRRRPPPALPRGGEPARAGERRRVPRELHPRGRRADRDEHVRRQPAQARCALPRGRARADQLDGRPARARGARGLGRATSSSPARSGRSARSSASTREQSTLFAEQAQVLEGRGVDLLMLETFFDLEELVAAIEAVRVGLVAADRRADDLRRGRADARRRLRRATRPSGWPGSGVAAVGANHSAGPAAALNALAAMQRDGLVLAALPNVGLASLAGSRVVFPHATPDYFAEFAAQARRLGAGIIGGCCGTTPAQIAAIRTAIDEERAPAGAARRPRARARRRGDRGAGGDEAGADAARAGVRRLRPARSAARGEQQRADRGRARAARSRARRTSSTSTTTRAPAPG